MQQIDYGFMSRDGIFLRVDESPYDQDNPNAGLERVFSLYPYHPIYETDRPGDILATLARCETGQLNSDEGIPSSKRIQIEDFVAIAFVRELTSVIDGGEKIPTSLVVRLARFHDMSDPTSMWFDDIENIMSRRHGGR